MIWNYLLNPCHHNTSSLKKDQNGKAMWHRRVMWKYQNIWGASSNCRGPNSENKIHDNREMGMNRNRSHLSQALLLLLATHSNAVQFLRCGVLQKIQWRFTHGGVAALRDASSRLQSPSSTPPKPTTTATTGHTLFSFLLSLPIRALILSPLFDFRKTRVPRVPCCPCFLLEVRFRFLFHFVEFRPINACLDPSNVRFASHFEGVSQLKEKWSEYNQPKRLRRLVSLFVSATAKHVAVAAGNRITFLSKEDDYQNPCAIFTSEIYLFN